MFNVIRRGPKRRLNQEDSSHFMRSLSLTEYNTILTEHVLLRPNLSGSRSVHLLTKASCRDEVHKHAFTNRQMTDRFHLPAMHSLTSACKIDTDNDNKSSEHTNLAYIGRSSISPASYHTRNFDPSYAYKLLSRRNVSYHFETRVSFSTRRTGARIPTPKTESSPSLTSTITSIDPTRALKKGLDMTWSMTKILFSFLVRLPGNTLYYAMNPTERKARISGFKDIVRKEFNHYWTGTKLLMADVRTARSLLGKTLGGSTLTRRERKQLLRTVSDLFRLVPVSMFIIIPMMDFLLPFALRLFPNMLPSTFQDSLKSEENMKRELKSRIAMARFFQDTMEELAKEQKRIVGKRNNEEPGDEETNKQIESAASMLEFLERARNGEMMPPDVIIQYATHFRDDLTLDNMPRMQLVNMCKYMGIAPYGSDNFLRFQLRYKIRSLKEDDQRILWEGIDSLTKMELREACQERGMRSTGLSKQAYKRSLQQWLDLSVNYDMPHSLLIMSRTYFLQDEIASATASGEGESVAGLADAISGLDKDVLNEVILEVATSEEKKSDPDVRKIKLEVLSQQNEKIREEEAEREKKKESAKKKKESAEKSQEKTEESAETSQAVEAVAASEDDSEKIQKGTPLSSIAKGYDVAKDIKAVKRTGKTAGDTVMEKTFTDEAEAEDAMEEEEVAQAAELSADEMEAIEQLVSADPVSKEREDLERIKSAMKENEEEPEEEASEQDVASSDQIAPDDAVEPVMDDSSSAAETIEAMEKEAAKEVDESTVFTNYSNEEGKVRDSTAMEEESEVIDTEEEPEEDVVVARLKRRIETMVDKIEVQLSKAEIQIGDKLHHLDKDMDGILTQEEIVQSLQQVLKRDITIEEAEDLVSEMDGDGDGVLTVQELISWLETNKLIKLENEGRDLDVDRILERQDSGLQNEDEATDE